MALNLFRRAQASEPAPPLRESDLAVLLPQIQGWLQNIQQGAMEQASLAAYVYGQVSIMDMYLLLPPITDDASKETFARFARMAQSLGPRVLKTRRSGAIGEVSWQGDLGQEWAGAFPEGKVGELARELFDQALITGIAAAIAYREDQVQEPLPRLSRLGGYLRLLYPPDDMSHEVALYQAWQSSHLRKWSWTVRIYEPRYRRMSEWRNVAAPYLLGLAPTEVVDDAPMPRWIVVQQGADGQPLGEFQQAWPLLRRELAEQIRTSRVEEATAFPILSTSGQLQMPMQERGPTRLLAFVEPAGKAAYLAPGDLGQMQANHDKTMARIRDDMSLPGGFLPSGGNPPSGQALREANIKYYTVSEYYANAIMSVVNAGLTDFAALANIAPQHIAITPSRSGQALEMVDRIAVLFEKGIIPLSVAAREVQPIMSSMSDAELDAWVAQNEERRQVVTPDTVRAILAARRGGGQAGAIGQGGPQAGAGPAAPGAQAEEGPGQQIPGQA